MKCINSYFENNISKFIGDPKSCWRFLNAIMGRDQTHSVDIVDESGLSVSADITKATIFNNYFINAVKSLKEGIQKYEDDNCNSLRTLRRHKKTFLFNTVTTGKVKNIIHSLKNVKDLVMTTFLQIFSVYYHNI